MDAYDSGTAAALGGGFYGSSLIAYLVFAFALSNVFVKAGEPRWAAFVPIYNLIVLAKISGINPLAVLLILIPGLGALIFLILSGLKLAQAFNKSSVFGIVAFGIFSFIGYLIVGVGADTYDRSRIQA